MYRHGKKPKAKNLMAEPSGGRSWSLLSGWPSSAPWTTASTVWGDFSHAEMEQAYSIHPVVRACVQEISTSAAEPRIEIGQYIADEWKPQRHDVSRLLEAPNEWYSRNDFIQYIASRTVLTGLGYVWKLRNAGNRMSALWPIPTSWVSKKRAKGLSLVSEYDVYGQDDPVSRDDLFAIRDIDPGTTDGASSRLGSAMHDYRLDEERENYQAEMVTNLKVPGLLLQTDRPLSPDTRRDLRADMKNRLGSGNRGEPLVLDEGLKVEMMNPLADLDWPGLTSLSETRICSAFGVPPILIGSRAGLDRSTYSNYEQARQSFYLETMASLWRQMAGALTAGLLRQEGDNVFEIRFRYDELPAFQENETEIAERVIKLFEAGIISQQEAREKIGYEANIDSGDSVSGDDSGRKPDDKKDQVSAEPTD